MKAKACTTCRQYKPRCDADVKHSEACSRCQQLGKQCTFDLNFRRTHRSRRLRELEQQLESSKQAIAVMGAESSHSQGFAPLPPDRNMEDFINVPHIPINNPVVVEPCVFAKQIGDVQLSAAQVTNLFRDYSVRCQPHLPMAVCMSPETVHGRCPILIRAICAAASSADPIPQLSSHITTLISSIIAVPSRSAEVAQALLILCTWPFPHFSTLEDPPFMYGALAMQIGLQIGLHRPGFALDFLSKEECLEMNEEARTTTWMASYVVCQLQSNRVGVPLNLPVDFAFQQMLDTQQFSPDLTALCRIAKFTAHCSASLGANGQTSSGLADSASRVDLVALYMDPAFVMYNDVARSEKVIESYQRAGKDAMELITMASEKNLSAYPVRISRQVFFAALVLIRIMWSPYATDVGLMNDKVKQAIRVLSCAVRMPDDHISRSCQILRSVLEIKDEGRVPPVQARMSASIGYDAIRVHNEQLQQNNASDMLTLLGLDALIWQDFEKTL